MNMRRFRVDATIHFEAQTSTRKVMVIKEIGKDLSLVVKVPDDGEALIVSGRLSLSGVQVVRTERALEEFWLSREEFQQIVS